MFMNVTCPTCGHRFRVPERSLGQQVKCPACSQLFQCGTTSPPSLMARPSAASKSPGVRETPPARAAQALPGQSIHYRCARCEKPLESPAHLAGHKINCPDCGQRLKIPLHSTAPPVSPDNKTILAAEEPPRVPVVPVSPAPPAPPLPVAEELVLTVLPASEPAPAVRREYCLECGVEVTRRPRIQTCPDCGSLFCSARCYRDHSYHAHPSRRR